MKNFMIVKNMKVTLVKFISVLGVFKWENLNLMGESKVGKFLIVII